MSDELIFDSERQARREKKKRQLIPFLALAVILVLVVAAVLILRGCKAEVHKGGESTDYTFSWNVKTNGDTQLVVPHDDYPKYRWDLKDREESLPVLRITRTGKDTKSGTVFTLHPEAAGRCLFTLILKGEDDAVVPSYEMIILAEVTETDGKLIAAPLNASGTRLQSEIIGAGRDPDVSGDNYRIYPDENRNLVLTFPAAEGETDWEYEIPSGEECLDLLGILYEDGNMNAYLQAGDTPGISELILKSDAAVTTIRLKLESGADGSLKILSHEAEYGEKPTVDPSSTVPVTTVTGGDAILVTSGNIPIFSDDHHLEVSEEPTQETPAR